MHSSPTVITRFAPSPTGALHVGGARTALYNWAFARHHGGRFLLRLEDTDQARSSDPAAAAILEDLAWIGLDWDNAGSVPRQSHRLDLYNTAIDQLRQAGYTYETNGAIRFKVPNKPITFHDEVRGDVTIPAGQTENFVIRKTDGFPTYHLAVVVDDAEMGVTHVLRAQEHLSNTPKHILLQTALGLPCPTYAHFGLILNPDGSKMSKRGFGPDEPVNVRDFRQLGFFPEVLCNYLALLGWNPSNDLEKFDKDFLAANFTLDRINKSNSKFDSKKLLAFNKDAISSLEVLELLQRLREFAERYYPHYVGFSRFLTFLYYERCKTLREPFKLGAFLFLQIGRASCRERV